VTFGAAGVTNGRRVNWYRQGAVRLLLVVNSFASSVTARNTVVVHQHLSRHHNVQVVETNRRGHATRFAQDAARRGLDAVVAFGGDGTLNEVATGVAGSETALAVLPGGSTNVFARTLGMPNDPALAVQQLVTALDRENIAPVGLGNVNGRYFCFHTGIGYDAAVVRAVERRASLKRWLGHPLFVGAALQTWAFGYSRKEPHFSVNIGEDAPVRGYFTIVMNTNPYTFLGNKPLNLSPQTTLDNGLSVVTFTSLSAAGLLGSLGKALMRGGIENGKRVTIHEQVKALSVTDDRPFPYQLDGDYLGETTDLRFTHVPEAVRLVMPVLDTASSTN
jgi:diacylglycerol kinase family enzyme